MRDYQRIYTNLWNKVPIKLQKEVGQMTEGSLQELFWKVIESCGITVVKKRKRSISHRASATCEFWEWLASKIKGYS